MTMQWKKLGVIWRPDGTAAWARSHGMGPTPVVLNDDVIRVYVTCLDDKGRGRPGYIDVAADDPTRVLEVSKAPLLDIGRPGTFDDNGVMVTSVIEPEPGVFYMYYAGFEICTQIRYRILTGLAISRDGGRSFVRHSEAPILDRSDGELYFRGGPFALHSDGVFKLWYVAGSGWTDLDGKAMPVYDLRDQTSVDGLHWAPRGQLSMDITEPDEHGFGRPWIVRRGPDDYQLFYSIRRRSLGAYRLGYAESADGIRWTRRDETMGLDVSSEGFDAQAIMYSAVVSAGGRTWCFYNGNGFGADGIAVAELTGT
jgi:hypothetical protein